MAKRKSTKGQTKIYKTYIKNQRSSNMNPTKNRGWTQMLRKSSISYSTSEHPSFYKHGDKSWTRNIPGSAYVKWNIFLVICDTHIP
jgi:hypothetical protein